MEAKTFRIPLDNVVKVQERLQKLERTAERLGIAFPITTISEPYRTKHLRPESRETYYLWWRDVTLEGEGIDRPVSIGGWQIIGQFNHEYPKVILNKLVDNILPSFISRFESENVSWCEHCNKKIRRHNTYVIQNENSQAQMLIGSACMHHYVPHQKSLDAIMSYYKTVQDTFMGSEADEDSIYYRSEPKTMDTDGYLRTCFQVLLIGVSAKSEDFSVVMGHLLEGTQPKDKQSEYFALVKKARANREDARSEMYHMEKFIQGLPEDNEFNVRLKRMCEPGYHLIKDCKTVIWGAVKYYEYLHRAKASPQETKWLGEVGQVIQMEVTFDSRKFLYSGEWGDSYLYIFKNKDGFFITWKTTYIDDDLEGNLVIRGRIKELTEYNGVKQTQISRARIWDSETSNGG